MLVACPTDRANRGGERTPRRQAWPTSTSVTPSWSPGGNKLLSTVCCRAASPTHRAGDNNSVGPPPLDRRSYSRPEDLVSTFWEILVRPGFVTQRAHDRHMTDAYDRARAEQLRRSEAMVEAQRFVPPAVRPTCTPTTHTCGTVRPARPLHDLRGVRRHNPDARGRAGRAGRARDLKWALRPATEVYGRGR